MNTTKRTKKPLLPMVNVMSSSNRDNIGKTRVSIKGNKLKTAFYASN